jgi:hypothetical protein
VEAEIPTLIFGKYLKGDAIYKDESVASHLINSWAFTGQMSGKVLQEHISSFGLATRSLTMGVMTTSGNSLPRNTDIHRAHFLHDNEHAPEN